MWRVYHCDESREELDVFLRRKDPIEAPFARKVDV